MRVGDFTVVIEDATGAAVAEVERTSGTGHPLVGEEVAIDDTVYTVDRVRHEDEPDGFSARTYMTARVFVRLGSTPHRRRPERSTPGDSRIPHLALPYEGGDEPLTSAILPAGLVAVLTSWGYRELATLYRRRRAMVARLAREGGEWALIADPPEVMWRKSRRAKRYYLEIETWMRGRAFGGITSFAPSAALAAPGRVLSLRLTRPTLRLV